MSDNPMGDEMGDEAAGLAPDLRGQVQRYAGMIDYLQGELQRLADLTEVPGSPSTLRKSHPGGADEVIAQLVREKTMREEVAAIQADIEGATADTFPPEGMVFTTSSTAEMRPEPPAQPMHDPVAAASECDHRGCRRKAYAVVSNEENVRWRACADHYEQDLAAQAIRVGHEPAWRVPIGPDVVLERRRGGPIGVMVDGQLRNYVTAGELARIFEGPVE